ncbi:hypothetical protein HUJ05_006341 [Dendroctonus ponderosae]|nr:hypothetical protein HUJ05_006341 [Dendroctonus ponderosae]
MGSTDYLKIAEKKIFKEACEVLPKNVSSPLNLIAVRESVLFTWDFSNNCVLSLNIKAARGKEGDRVFHQRLPDGAVNAGSKEIYAGLVYNVL